MKAAPAGSLLTFLSAVPDPRGRQGHRHPLEAMLASIVCAMLQGARGYSAIAQWLHHQDVALWHALGFTRRPPQEGAFRKLLLALSPRRTSSKRCGTGVRIAWGCVLPRPALEAVALDGKTLCQTLQPHERAVHLLSLLDQRSGCTLSQSRVDAKTNEHKAALELLKSLVLEGRVITGDAIFCQREVCQQIRDREEIRPRPHLWRRGARLRRVRSGEISDPQYPGRNRSADEATKIPLGDRIFRPANGFNVEFCGAASRPRDGSGGCRCPPPLRVQERDDPVLSRRLRR